MQVGPKIWFLVLVPQFNRPLTSFAPCCEWAEAKISPKRRRKKKRAERNQWQLVVDSMAEAWGEQELLLSVPQWLVFYFATIAFTPRIIRRERDRPVANFLPQKSANILSLPTSLL